MSTDAAAYIIHGVQIDQEATEAKLRTALSKAGKVLLITEATPQEEVEAVIAKKEIHQLHIVKPITMQEARFNQKTGAPEASRTVTLADKGTFFSYNGYMYVSALEAAVALLDTEVLQNEEEPCGDNEEDTKVFGYIPSFLDLPESYSRNSGVVGQTIQSAHDDATEEVDMSVTGHKVVDKLFSLVGEPTPPLKYFISCETFC